MMFDTDSDPDAKWERVQNSFVGSAEMPHTRSMYMEDQMNRKSIGLHNVFNAKHFTSNIWQADGDILWLIFHIATKMGIPFLEG